jgi:hypothetical protein
MGWSFYNSSGQLLTAPASTATADTATVATTVTITDNESTDENNVIVFVAGADADGGNVGLESDGTLHYNPSTGKVTATSFAGNLTGNVTGNTSGTAGSATGNAATATALQTARNIGGVSFDGTGNITLPGVNSSGNQNTSGNAATVTTNANLTGHVTSSGNATTLVLSALTGAAVDVANDSIAIIDANDSNGSRKETIADLATAMAGANLTASSGQLVAGAAGAGLGLVIALS